MSKSKIINKDISVSKIPIFDLEENIFYIKPISNVFLNKLKNKWINQFKSKISQYDIESTDNLTQSNLGVSINIYRDLPQNRLMIYLYENNLDKFYPLKIYYRRKLKNKNIYESLEQLNEYIDLIRNDCRDINKSLREIILERDNYTCRMCQDNIYDNPECMLHLDHIFPKSKGGSNKENNLQILCRSCNLKKGDKIL